MNNFVKEIKYFIEDIKNWKNLSPNPIKRRFYSFQENRYYIKNKSCCACQHFNWFMGCVGVCEIKKGCPANRMKDYSDTCDCNQFKKRKNR